VHPVRPAVPVAARRVRRPPAPRLAALGHRGIYPELLTIMIATRFLDSIARFQQIPTDYRPIRGHILVGIVLHRPEFWSRSWFWSHVIDQINDHYSLASLYLSLQLRLAIMSQSTWICLLDSESVDSSRRFYDSSRLESTDSSVETIKLADLSRLWQSLLPTMWPELIGSLKLGNILVFVQQIYDNKSAVQKPKHCLTWDFPSALSHQRVGNNMSC